MTVQLEYINHLLQFFKIFSIMLGLCLMLSVTYYAQIYVGIISWSLIGGKSIEHNASIIGTNCQHNQQNLYKTHALHRM